VICFSPGLIAGYYRNNLRLMCRVLCMGRVYKLPCVIRMHSRNVGFNAKLFFASMYSAHFQDPRARSKQTVFNFRSLSLSKTHTNRYKYTKTYPSTSALLSHSLFVSYSTRFLLSLTLNSVASLPRNIILIISPLFYSLIKKLGKKNSNFFFAALQKS